ncbi:hypothetical protein BX600DRAFT_61806 [Xylariales sp. PMI_506]|nr:hypothetical protein BX600DRAFT_61806 [Xylariales sp. PMI_506]
MPIETVSKRVRKGTHSCTECRKRKLKCTWTSSEARYCRRCEERGSLCIPQTVASPSTTATHDAPSTRDRVSSLERQVSVLTKSLLDVQRRLGNEEPGRDTQTMSMLSPLSSQLEKAHESEDPEDESMLGDVGISSRPTYLNSLFNNSLLSSASSSGNTTTATAAAAATNSQIFHSQPSHLAALARRMLQPLIPAEQDIPVIASRSLGWLSLLHDLFPLNSIIKSGEDMLMQYDRLRQPTADPVALAAWLLSVALTTEHMPQRELPPSFSARWPKGRPGYSRLVLTAIEDSVISHDRLISSRDGMEMMMMTTRLCLTIGNFRKSFLLLRRALAIAELIGLPRAVDGPRAGMWKFMCGAERIHSTIFAFSSVTRFRHSLTPSTSMSDTFDADGHLVPQNFLLRLTGIAVRLEDLPAAQQDALAPGTAKTTAIAPSDGLYEIVSRVDEDLRALAATAPPGWWANGLDRGAAGDLPLADRMMQYFYHYVMIRAHLPMFLRSQSSPASIASRATCIRSCEALMQGYLGIYPLFPEGYFIHRIMDLQAFTAVIVWIIADHAVSLDQRTDGNASNERAFAPDKPDGLIAQVVQAMDYNAERSESTMAKQATVGIRSLAKMLSSPSSGPEDSSPSFDLHVPLLGRIHVQRKPGVPIQSDAGTAPARGGVGQIVTAQCPMVEGAALAEDPMSFDTAFLDFGREFEGPFAWSIEDALGTLPFDNTVAESYGF